MARSISQFRCDNDRAASTSDGSAARPAQPERPRLWTSASRADQSAGVFRHGCTWLDHPALAQPRGKAMGHRACRLDHGECNGQWSLTTRHPLRDGQYRTLVSAFSRTLAPGRDWPSSQPSRWAAWSSTHRLDHERSECAMVQPRCRVARPPTARDRWPPFITSFTWRRVLMSWVGSPSTATRSARRPGLTAPRRSSRRRVLAATEVAARSASTGFIP